MVKPHALLIAGPTGCGKSALALRLAQDLDGVIINADSMQLYRDLKLLTARPGPEAEALAPHRLYGALPAAERGSVGRWLALARTEVEAAAEAGKVPIVVGGTGLYLTALTAGLARIPPIPEAVRAEARRRLEQLGNHAFHARLAGRDPVMAARLRASDSQRLVRAYEVLEATGRSLAEWQSGAVAELPLTLPWRGFVLELPRQALYRRIDRRFDDMLAAGALDEVRALAASALDPSLPVMRALAVPELIRHLAGELDLEVAAGLAKQATRRYAKRQMTWFRNKMRAWAWIVAQDSESFYERIIPEMINFRLTRGV